MFNDRRCYDDNLLCDAVILDAWQEISSRNYETGL